MRCVKVTNWVGRAALSIVLIGCVGDATEPNEKNFAAALNASLEKEGESPRVPWRPVGLSQAMAVA